MKYDEWYEKNSCYDVDNYTNADFLNKIDIRINNIKAFKKDIIDQNCRVDEFSNEIEFLLFLLKKFNERLNIK